MPLSSGKISHLRRQREVLQVPADAARRRAARAAAARSSSALQLELDALDRLAIGRVGLRRIVHRERVERVAVPRRVDLGVEDRQSRAAEEAADAREQLLLVGQVDEHLQPGAVARQARLARPAPSPSGAPVQVPRVPGDLVGGVALEVDAVELAPEARLGALGHRVEAQQPLRLAAAAPAGCRRASRAARRAGEPRPRRVEQVLEQLRLPRVPHLRARAADVGDGEQVERGQPALGRRPSRRTRR